MYERIIQLDNALIFITENENKLQFYVHPKRAEMHLRNAIYLPVTARNA